MEILVEAEIIDSIKLGPLMKEGNEILKIVSAARKTTLQK